ncbi:hydroxyacid dehydrogenase [Candidatus Shapirobacteria bacterium]|nr:MAG: hydroxyacid dehydrogenase [Candidatus Shapirobacteria bacterium]
MTKKIAFFGVRSWEKDLIEKEISNLDSFGVGIFKETVEENLELAGKYEVLSVFVNSKLDKKILSKLPKLEMVASRSTGLDHIDMDWCQKKGVVVKNVPEYGSVTVAEYAMALLMAVAKKIVVAHQAVEEGEFNPEGLTGIDLFSKTLGVVGVGRIGRNMIRLGRAMGMKVVGVGRTKKPELEKELGFKYVSLEECLEMSDAISLHVPATPETFHLINRNNIVKMKKGSILINTCRGPVMEVESILWALDEGILRGVGLDVAEEERKVVDDQTVMDNKTSKDDLKELLSFHLLRDRDDVVYTPHNAFNTEEAVGRIVKKTIENIKEFLGASLSLRN